MKIPHSQKGFTLIELLVVVSIMALLISIIIAVLTDARGGAKNNVRNETARQYITALGLYHGEYGHYPKNGVDNTTSVCLGAGYPNGICYVIGLSNQNAVVNNEIKEFIPGLPASLDKTVSGETEFYGIQYSCEDSSCLNYSLSWIVEGTGNDSNCFGGGSKISLNSRIGLCIYSTT